MVDHFLFNGCLFGLPKTVKEAISCWRGSFVGKKRKKIWNSITLYIFLTAWMERNRMAFKDGVLAVQ